MEAVFVPEKTQIKAIFFDFGKTIHDYHLDYFFNWLSYKFGLPRHYFWRIFNGSSGLIMKYEVGMPTKRFLKEFRARVELLFAELAGKEGKRIASAEFTDEEFIDAWNSIMDPSPLIRDRMELIRKLKGHGYKIYILSNTNKAHIEYFKGSGKKTGYHYTRFSELFRVADRFFASSDHDVRARKTKFDGKNRKLCEKVFWKVLNATGLKPEEAVFVDDFVEYVEVFKAMGGYAIHCTGSWTKVEAELYQMGVRWE
ncbi:MAG: hypothetical protein A3A28_05710 [Candidatus Sungbacteria bacterium RIFCSPLOWO2_01_FULL_47_32]|nr:MAG: hypothetical protein A3A28_05710 [Candidatus Sungbacteria bacterium RIFCSPLOWO2_01_FULL_47_32]